MRKSYNGLSALVKHHLLDNPLNGSLYVFINRKGDQMKILFFDRNGYSIWGKRLEQGQFVIRHSGEIKSPSATRSFSVYSMVSNGAMLSSTSVSH